MKTSGKKRYSDKTEVVKKGPGTFYSDLQGKGKGQRQSHPTHDDLLKMARAAQYVQDDRVSTPFQMPTSNHAVGYSVRLPVHFLEELNKVRFGMAPYWGNMLEAFGDLFEKSQELREWLGEKMCEAIYASNSHYDRLAKKAAKDLKRVKALKAEKVMARGEIVVSALRQVISEVSEVKGFDGLPLNLTAPVMAGRNTRLDIVREFGELAKKTHWEIQKRNRQAELPDQNKGKSQRAKSHKPSRGNDRMAAVKEAIVALASAD